MYISTPECNNEMALPSSLNTLNLCSVCNLRTTLYISFINFRVTLPAESDALKMNTTPLPARQYAERIESGLCCHDARLQRIPLRITLLW